MTWRKGYHTTEEEATSVTPGSPREFTNFNYGNTYYHENWLSVNSDTHKHEIEKNEVSTYVKGHPAYGPAGGRVQAGKRIEITEKPQKDLIAKFHTSHYAYASVDGIGSASIDIFPFVAKDGRGFPGEDSEKLLKSFAVMSKTADTLGFTKHEEEDNTTELLIPSGNIQSGDVLRLAIGAQATISHDLAAWSTADASPHEETTPDLQHYVVCPTIEVNWT